MLYQDRGGNFLTHVFADTHQRSTQLTCWQKIINGIFVYKPKMPMGVEIAKYYKLHDDYR